MLLLWFNCRVGATSRHVEMAAKKCLLLLYVGQWPCSSSVKPRQRPCVAYFLKLVWKPKPNLGVGFSRKLGGTAPSLGSCLETEKNWAKMRTNGERWPLVSN